MRRSRSRDWRSDGRGQSELIGVVLVLSLTVIGATAVAATGASVLADSRSNSQVSQAENAMSQMSSKASLVALGESESQSFDLGRLDKGAVDVREDAGHVTVYKETENGGSEELYSQPYGAVVTTAGDTEIAYQGGGVWRKDGNRSVMASPPEFHYRSNTLTFPIVRVSGEGRASGDVTGQFAAGGSEGIYPDGEGRTNPLEEGTVVVEIESDYYDAWYRFFDGRTAGEVEIDHATQTVRVELTVPREEEIENAVAVATPDGITANGGDKPEPHREGVQYPSASRLIDQRVETCTETADCTELADETTIMGEAGAKNRYYATGEDLPGSLVFETNGEDVELVVDGTFEVDDLDIEGEGDVSIYVTDGFVLGGNSEMNAGGSSPQLRVYVHSDAVVTSQKGTPSFTGVLYAPNTDVELSGNTDFEGALIARTLHVNGNAGGFEYDDRLAEITIEVDTSRNPIRYLHVTENRVDVELR